MQKTVILSVAGLLAVNIFSVAYATPKPETKDNGNHNTNVNLNSSKSTVKSSNTNTSSSNSNSSSGAVGVGIGVGGSSKSSATGGTVKNSGNSTSSSNSVGIGGSGGQGGKASSTSSASVGDSRSGASSIGGAQYQIDSSIYNAAFEFPTYQYPQYQIGSISCPSDALNFSVYGKSGGQGNVDFDQSAGAGGRNGEYGGVISYSLPLGGSTCKKASKLMVENLRLQNELLRKELTRVIPPVPVNVPSTQPINHAPVAPTQPVVVPKVKVDEPVPALW